ncbi:hypothetical protein [Streptomyces sp. NPDC052036]
MRIEDVRRHLTTPAYAPTVPRSTDLTLAPVEPVFDYLKGDAQ